MQRACPELALTRICLWGKTVLVAIWSKFLCNHSWLIQKDCLSWYYVSLSISTLGFPRWLSAKEPTCQCGRQRRRALVPGSGRSPGEGSGNPLQYSCLENSMDRGAWWATVHGVTKGQTPHTHIHTHISMSVWYFSYIMEIILLTCKLIY